MQYRTLRPKHLFLDESGTFTLDAETWEAVAASIQRLRERRLLEERAPTALSPVAPPPQAA